jgi:hypothetical protein
MLTILVIIIVVLILTSAAFWNLIAWVFLIGLILYVFPDLSITALLVIALVIGILVQIGKEIERRKPKVIQVEIVHRRKYHDF